MKCLRSQILSRIAVMHARNDKRINAVKIPLVERPKARSIALRLRDQRPLVGLRRISLQPILRDSISRKGNLPSQKRLREKGGASLAGSVVGEGLQTLPPFGPRVRAA